MWAPPFDAAVIVDPGEARPVLRQVERRDLRISAILLTHHHDDHVGGVRDLLKRGPAPVYGPSHESIPVIDHPLDEGDRVSLSEFGIELEVLDVPGHTIDHIAYVGPGFALVGDSLFAGGCGRIFEGTPHQMYKSLAKIAALPPDTSIYCAHEYTAANLRFALELEPENRQLSDRLDKTRETRIQGLPTVPSTLAEELATNPFLRCDEPEIKAAAEARVGRPLDGPAEVFAVIRRWKDGWPG